MDSKYPSLKITRNPNGVVVLAFNLPEQLNSMGGPISGEFEAAMVELSDDEQTNVIIITGEGKAFSAGGDVKVMAQEAGTEKGWKTAFNLPTAAKRTVELLLNCTKPTIAAINGDAMGLGATIALCCDMQIMADTARIADTHVKVGLVAGDGGSLLWPLLVGANRAKEYLLLGQFVDGPTAEKVGLVNHCLPRDQVMAKAMDMANRMVALPQLALRWTKVSMNKVLQQNFNLVMEASSAYEMMSMVTKDHKEACIAFAEKRKPRFIGA